MKITFEPKNKIIASFDDFRVVSDFPEAMGGENTAPNPFELFMASLGNCTGFFLSNFYKNHDMSLEGVSLTQECEFDDNKNIQKVVVSIEPGKDYKPEKEKALIASLKACKVKQHLNPNIKVEYKIIS